MRQNYQISEQFPSQEEEEALSFPLFARKEYWLLHLEEEFLVPVTIRNQRHQIIAFFCFCKSENRLTTPFKAPFFIPYLNALEKVGLLFPEVINYCKTKYSLPMLFTLKSDLNLLNLINFTPSLKIVNIELGSQLSISNDSFLQQIKKKRKRRKLKSLFAGNTFEIKEVNINEWEEVYEQNLSWRKEKEHQNFMSKEEMANAKMQFPKSYQAFQLKKGQNLIGTAFFLRVDHNLIYVYSLITAPTIDSEEPSLLLWKAIYDYANEHNISTVNMGTSMLPEGIINKNLARYKKFIGGLHYKKYTFEC